MSEVLERGELQKAVDLLKGHYWQSQGSMDLMLQAVGVDPKSAVSVDFLTFLRILKMLGDSDTRRKLGEELGFDREQADFLYSGFRSLEPQSNSTIKRSLLERALTSLAQSRISKGKLLEFQRLMASEAPRVDFGTFLRLAKFLQTNIEREEFQAVAAELLNWRESSEGRQAAAEQQMSPSNVSW